MKTTKLDHLNFTVRDLKESIAWYRKVFGFELVERGNNGDSPYAIIKSGDTMLCLYETQERKFLDRFKMTDRNIHNINHFALRVDDKEEWERVVEENNIEVDFGGEYRYDNSSSWYINDPTGYQIEVVLWDDDEIRFSSEKTPSRNSW